MSGLEFLLMCMFTVIGIKYVVDMIKFSKGYEINGKCRYGKKYARELAKKCSHTVPKESAQESGNLHQDISNLIATITVS